MSFPLNIFYIYPSHTEFVGRYSDWLRAGWSGDRIPVWAKFSAPVQTGPGAPPASCTMGTGSLPGVKSSLGVTLTPHPLLVPWSRKRRATPPLPVWAARPVQSLSACTRVHFYSVFASCTTRFNTPKYYVVPTQYIGVFSVGLRTKNDYFPVHNKLICF